jgi:putative NADH-flavin reductase
LGPSILKALLEDGFNVSVLKRQSSTSTVPSGVKVVKSDFTTSSLIDVLEGQDAVIDIIAQSSVEDRQKIIDAAISAGVKRFIPSEFSSNMENEANVALLPSIYGARVAVREYLKKQAVAHTGFTWTTLSTGPFFDWVCSFYLLHYMKCTSDSNRIGNESKLPRLRCEVLHMHHL